ncbi:FAD/NAD(P)-binding protein [Roseobacteraceae bacterium NS-SX3]
MQAGRPEPKIALAGFGPRGLGALEALAQRAQAGGPVAVDIFEPSEWPGAGPNFSPGESIHCLLNLPLREVSLPTPVRGGAGGFSAWPGVAGRGEDFCAPRAELGRYLSARFSALLERLPKGMTVTLIPRQVTRLHREGTGWRVETAESRHGPYGEVLLCPGQPRTAPDRQIGLWRQHARRYGLDLISAYPGPRLLAAARGWAGRTVGIRGLGLATLDVMRLLTSGLGGRFEGGAYRPSGQEPARLVAFSLDGQPPAPKPATAGVDAAFEPQAGETRAFEAALQKAVQAPPAAALEALCAPLHAAAQRILHETGHAQEAERLEAWLAAEVEAPGSQENRPPVRALAAHIGMARGLRPPSAGYAVGQVWRKWQAPLRRIVNAAETSPATASALAGFNEGLARYSYGPPVEAAEQLRILAQAGRVDLRAARDPDIDLAPEGWVLREEGQALQAAAMVDAVLSPPVLSEITDPLVAGLRDAGILAAIKDGLGARTDGTGRVLDAHGTPVPGLSLTGRLASGSVIAPDSIHDCFGGVGERWAARVLDA